MGNKNRIVLSFDTGFVTCTITSSGVRLNIAHPAQEPSPGHIKFKAEHRLKGGGTQTDFRGAPSPVPFPRSHLYTTAHTYIYRRKKNAYHSFNGEFEWC